jgi:hypothetical protein
MFGEELWSCFLYIVFFYIVHQTTASLYHSTQQHAKQHAYNQQQIQYHNSMHQVTNAATLNFDFNLYDKIISFTVLHILQTQNVYKIYY